MTVQAYNPDQMLITQYSSATVIGLGATGYSVVRYLRARGLEVTVLDSRAAPPMAAVMTDAYPEVAVVFGAFDAVSVQDADLIIASPGISLKEPMLIHAKNNGAHIVGDIELFLQENRRPVLAVTGSNGKSTVTTLVGAMVKAGGLSPLVAGNIGRPVLDALTEGESYDIAVLELSSFQLETTSQVPAEAAAILNISADHMDRYESMGDYVLAKARILRNAKCAVLPRHDEQLKQITNVGRVLDFDLDEPANDDEFGVKQLSSVRWLMKGRKRLMRLKDVPLIGLHNVLNVLSAFALVDCLKIPTDALVSAVKEFKGLPHRMETIAVANGVTWVNDSKATNVGATVTALRNLENPVIWIAGGQGKDADFEDLRDALGSHVELAILIGEDAAQIEVVIDGAVAVEHADSMQQAVEIAGQHAKDGCVVLLSPACASFDMFRNFEDRGNTFSACVQDWIARGTQ